MLQSAAECRRVLQRCRDAPRPQRAGERCKCLQNAAECPRTLQNAATNCRTLEHGATDCNCNGLQRTAECSNAAGCGAKLQGAAHARRTL
eukprot:3064020-Lingulodinium_polyedra.AAC.1